MDNVVAPLGLKWRCPSLADDNNVPGDFAQSVKNSRASCDCGGNFSRQKDMVTSCMLLIRTPFDFLYLLGPCFRNLVFYGLSGKVKHFRPKVAKDGHPNNRKFVTFGIPKEPNSKSVSAKLKIGSGFSDIAFIFLACSSMPSQLHVNRVTSL